MLGGRVERVRVSGERFVITRYGKPAAVLVNAKWLEQAQGELGTKGAGQ